MVKVLAGTSPKSFMGDYDGEMEYELLNKKNLIRKENYEYK